MPKHKLASYPHTEMGHQTLTGFGRYLQGFADVAAVALAVIACT